MLLINTQLLFYNHTQSRSVMNKTKLTWTLVIVAATAALMVAPALTGTVLAVKEETCTVGGSQNLCEDTGVGDNEQAASRRESCTAGNGNAMPSSCSGAK